MSADPSKYWSITRFEAFIKDSDKLELVFHTIFWDRNGGYPPEKIVIDDKEKIGKIVSTIKLISKKPCGCIHQEQIIFWQGRHKLEVNICSHCFDIIVDKTVKRFKMPEGLYELFQEYQSKHDDKKN